MIDASVRGEAVITNGLEAETSAGPILSGLGLLTFGFVWECSAIWLDTTSTTTTTWTDSTGGIFGDC